MSKKIYHQNLKNLKEFYSGEYNEKGINIIQNKLIEHLNNINKIIALYLNEFDKIKLEEQNKSILKNIIEQVEQIFRQNPKYYHLYIEIPENKFSKFMYKNLIIAVESLKIDLKDLNKYFELKVPKIGSEKVFESEINSQIITQIKDTYEDAVRTIEITQLTNDSYVVRLNTIIEFPKNLELQNLFILEQNILYYSNYKVLFQHKNNIISLIDFLNKNLDLNINLKRTHHTMDN